MKQKLMDLYFTEGADLTDREVLVKAASRVGLDAEKVRDALASDKDVAEVEREATVRQGSRHRGRADASSSAANSRCRARRRRNISPRRSSAPRNQPDAPAPPNNRNEDHRRRGAAQKSGAVRDRDASISPIRAPTNCWSRSSPAACARPICTAATAITPTPYPAVFGHEGAGIVRAVGSAVPRFKPGDHVVMAYPWCGECPNCRAHTAELLPAMLATLKMSGTRADGSTLHSKDGKPIYSAFFQQSSFGTYTIANERYAVKVRNDAPLESLGAARLRRADRRRRGAQCRCSRSRATALAVFGVGAVGLSGLMAAQDRRLRSDHRGRRARASA